MTMAEITSPSPAANVWERLKAITTRKRQSARAKHFEFVHRVAAGKELNDKQLEEFHGCSSAAGFTDVDTAAHVRLVQRIAAAEANEKELPRLLNAVRECQALMDKTEQDISDLQLQFNDARMRQSEASLRFQQAASSAAGAEALRSELAELESE